MLIILYKFLTYLLWDSFSYFSESRDMENRNVGRDVKPEDII